MNMRAAVPLSIGCLMGSYLGGKYGAHIAYQNLKLGFATVMSVMGVRTVVQAIKIIRKVV